MYSIKKKKYIKLGLKLMSSSYYRSGSRITCWIWSNITIGVIEVNYYKSRLGKDSKVLITAGNNSTKRRICIGQNRS